MVLQVIAHRQFVHQRNAVLLQQRTRPDTRQLQDLRAADGTSRQYGFALCRSKTFFIALKKLDAAHLPAFEPQFFNQRAGDDFQVGTIHHRSQERLRCTPAQPVFLRHLKPRHAEIVAAVEILRRRYAGFDGRVAEGIDDVPLHTRRFDAQFTACTMFFIGAAPVVFDVHERRQHVLPRPAAVTRELRPSVVIAGLTAQIQHRVDRRRTAQYTTARIVDDTAIESGFRFGAITPVGARVADAVQITDGDVNPVPVVAPARFEQQHRHCRIRRQPVGQQATGAARADDHIVVITECVKLFTKDTGRHKISIKSITYIKPAPVTPSPASAHSSSANRRHRYCPVHPASGNALRRNGWGPCPGRLWPPAD